MNYGVAAAETFDVSLSPPSGQQCLVHPSLYWLVVAYLAALLWPLSFVSSIFGCPVERRRTIKVVVYHGRATKCAADDVIYHEQHGRQFYVIMDQ